jgi:hypothetical protein
MRKNKSLLNNWVNTQAGNREALAKKLGVTYGNMKSWLSKGFVTKKHIPRVSKKTGIDEKKLVAEYNAVNGIVIEGGETWDIESQKYIPVEEV